MEEEAAMHNKGLRKEGIEGERKKIKVKSQKIVLKGRKGYDDLKT